MILDKNYWSSRYQKNETGWDAGSATAPIVAYFNTIENLDAKILIPGCGNAHEAEYLHKCGFRQVYICDWAAEPLADFATRVPDFPKQHLLCMDFFDITLSDVDFVVEQTFFCALPPTLRAKYIQKIAELLAPTGKMVGLLFRFPLSAQGPPFGGSETEYRQYFEPYFDAVSIQPCLNSIPPRLGNEFWIEIAQKKQNNQIWKSYVELKVFEGLLDKDSTYDGKMHWRYDVYAVFYEDSPTYTHFKQNPDFYADRLRQEGKAYVPAALSRNGFTRVLMPVAHAAACTQGRQLPLVEAINDMAAYAALVQYISNEIA